MKEKGFTLIELLAVIVILAIIALIAVPIIINIVNDARENSYKRSVELYGKSIQNAIAKAQLNGQTVQAGELDIDSLNVQYDGAEVTCETNMLYEDGKIYLAGCSVGTHQVEYTYGTEQKSGPDYYSWGSGSIGGSLPNVPVPEGKNFYLGFDSADGETIDAVYVCFVVTKNNNPVEYCIQGGVVAELRAGVFTSNQGKLDEAFPGACSLDDDNYGCSAGGLAANADSDGNVSAYDGGASCGVGSSGGFACAEF